MKYIFCIWLIWNLFKRKRWPTFLCILDLADKESYEFTVVCQSSTASVRQFKILCRNHWLVFFLVFKVKLHYFKIQETTAKFLQKIFFLCIWVKRALKWGISFIFKNCFSFYFAQNSLKEQLLRYLVSHPNLLVCQNSRSWVTV